MAVAMLRISGHGETWHVESNPKGTIIGRSPKCDVVLESRDVSREHVRIFQDPFARWIVEDLGSSNGTFINGKRIESRAVLPGEPIVVGSFSLSVAQPLEQQIPRDDSVEGTNMVVEDFETEVFYGKTMLGEGLSDGCSKQLSEFTERLSELTSSSALYPEVCRYLAEAPRTVAVVLRLPDKSKPLPKSPDIIACHFGGAPEETAAPGTVASYPSRLAFRVSRHVLEDVRSKGNPMMAKSIYSSDEEITSTFVDEHSPRSVICAPLGEVADIVDVLYLDIPIDETTGITPEQMFAFCRAVSEEVVSARKSLSLMQLKADASTLDHELSLAQKIQARLTPVIPKDLRDVDVALHYEPVMWVGGDYCDVWSLKDGRLAFAVGDVSDMGLPAAVVMSTLRILLRTTMSFSDDLSEVMKHVNAHLIQDVPERTSATLFLGLFDSTAGTLEYINAGHAQPLIVEPKSPVEPLGQASYPALGAGDTVFETKSRTVKQAGQLILFTDGVTGTKSPEGEQFGVKRLTNLFESAKHHSAEQIADSVVQAVTGFRQTLAQQDDTTIFVLINRKGQ